MGTAESSLTHMLLHRNEFYIELIAVLDACLYQNEEFSSSLTPKLLRALIASYVLGF